MGHMRITTEIAGLCHRNVNNDMQRCMTMRLFFSFNMGNVCTSMIRVYRRRLKKICTLEYESIGKQLALANRDQLHPITSRQRKYVDECCICCTETCYCSKSSRKTTPRRDAAPLQWLTHATTRLCHIPPCPVLTPRVGRVGLTL